MLVDRNADRVLIALSGEFTMDSGKRFENALNEIGQDSVRELVIDLGGVTFIDSTAAFMLLQLQHRFEGRATVTFEGGTRQTQALLRTAGLQGSVGESNNERPRHTPPLGLPHASLPAHLRRR